MNALQIIEKTVLGTNWYIEVWPVDGYSIWVTDSDNGTLYNKRVIDDSLYEAICHVVWQIWEKELYESDDWELPGRIANALGITEPEYEEA